jgi:hypothetical protein
MDDLTPAATDCLAPVDVQAPRLVGERRLKELQLYPFDEVDRQVSR